MITKKTVQQRLVTMAGLVVLGAAAVLMMSGQTYAPVTPMFTARTAVQPDGNAVTVTGAFACLPATRHGLPERDAVSVPTEGCVPGIASLDGTQYAVDLTGVQSMPEGLDAATPARVSGQLVPIEALSSDRWQSYDIAGIILVTEVSVAR